MSRPGNVQRALWRTKCREALAAHLESRLGLTIDPTLVRLKPNAQDGYSWSFIPEKAYLFTKPLSKLSLGNYVELCREVGKSFEAVKRNLESSTSFASTIKDLKQEHLKIQETSVQWQESAVRERELRQSLEAKTQEMQLAVSDTLREINRLTSKNHRLQDQVSCLQRKLEHSQRRNKKAFRAFRELEQIVQKESDGDSEHLEDDC